MKRSANGVGQAVPGAASNAPAMAEVVIKASEVGKAYRLFDHSHEHLKDQLFGRFGRRYGHDLWALQNVSFDVRRGEAFGIIGRNGSGKSTLLQLIVGVLQPTSGRLATTGRINALLELGSGFDPELTGRENIYLAGSVLGYSAKQISEILPRVIEFSELGEFIEQPVKYYSSGMFVRLAFALNTCVDTDILILDEALAVGDVFFQQKCYRRLESLRQQGVTILLVSHAMAEVEQFCDRALVLDGGQALFVGDAREAVQRYYLVTKGGSHAPESQPIPVEPSALWPQHATDQPELWPGGIAPASDAWMDISGVQQVSNGWARCLRVALSDERGRSRRVFEQGETAVFYSEFEVLAPIDVPIAGIVLHNARGVIVHGKSTLEHGTSVPAWLVPGDRVRFKQTISLQIGVGEHTFELGISSMPAAAYEQRASLPHELLAAYVTRLCDLPDLGPIVVTYRANGRPVQLLHHGTANLPGDCMALAERVHEANPTAASVVSSGRDDKGSADGP